MEQPSTTAGNATVADHPPAVGHGRSPFGELKNWIRDVVFAGFAAILIVVFIVQPVKVEGTSMLPELVNQERIFVNKFVYHFTEIHRGDIVVFWYPLDHRKSFIKRVIGLPGDVVQLKGGKVYIKDRLLEEPYLQREFADQESYLPVVVQEGHYYVLGDNRGSSNDSRSWGLVPRENIFGKAVFRYWPLSRLGTIE